MSEQACEYITGYEGLKKNKRYRYCGRPAYYEWRVKDERRWMCKEHGEVCAGNYIHELRLRSLSEPVASPDALAYWRRFHGRKNPT